MSDASFGCQIECQMEMLVSRCGLAVHGSRICTDTRGLLNTPRDPRRWAPPRTADVEFRTRLTDVD